MDWVYLVGWGWVGWVVFSIRLGTFGLQRNGLGLFVGGFGQMEMNSSFIWLDGGCVDDGLGLFDLGEKGFLFFDWMGWVGLV